MPNKAVFLDRDNTLIDDPGYLADPDALRMLPGVELALKSLSQAGYLLLVVTNQSGVARGLLTEEALQKVHERMLELLERKGAHIDEIYYCPYHAEGTVPEYAIESDLRKPEPGMLLQAGDDLDLDFSACWMVGDSSRDIEAGQRAGCRTIRIRPPHGDEVTDDRHEDFQADFTVRNLVEAARVILRSRSEAPAEAAEAAATGRDDDVVLNLGSVSAAGAPEPRTGVATLPPLGEEAEEAEDAYAQEDEPVEPELAESEADSYEPFPPPEPVEEAQEAPVAAAAAETTSSDQIRQEILREVRQMARSQATEEFSFWRLAGTIVQILAILALGLTLMHLIRSTDGLARAQAWGIVAVALQVMALTLTMMQRSR